MPLFRTLAGLLGLGASLVAAAQTAPATPPPVASVADFARLAEIDKARLSPTGEFVAALASSGDQTSLIIFKTASREVVSGLKLADKDNVVDYHWSGPAEVVTEMGSSDGPLGEVVSTGELMVLEAVPGASARYLIGWRGNTGVAGSRVKVTAESDVRAFAEVVDPTPENPASLLIALHEWGSAAVEPPVGIYEIDTRSSRRKRIAVAPRPYCDFVVDTQGRLRFAVCIDYEKETEVQTYRYKGVGNGTAEGWEAMAASGATVLVPQFVSRDNRWAYFSATGLKGSPSDAACLARQPLDGNAPLAIVSCQAGFDVQSAITSADGKEVLAAYYEPDQPQLDFVENKHPDGELLLALQQSFGGQLALPVSASLNGNIWLLSVASDRRSPAYYLYNRQTKEASKLFEQYPTLAKSPMQPVKPVSFTARDGVKVYGYLTLPRPGTGKPPLVVLPHGGPFGVRESWFFDPESQLLASRGYAVLRVNFRGSGGYGDKYRNSARRKWGTLMIDDITDATRHVIGQGQVDGNRVAIYGGSYGGYAALMSAVREPTLYKAVVSVVGISDLVLWKNDSIASESKLGKTYISRYVGDNDEELRKQSPIEYLDKLKAPVFIAHGEADVRVPINQAKRLRSALDKKNHPYEWLVKYDEGHGFYRQAARVEFYDKLLAFLGKNLKP